MSSSAQTAIWAARTEYSTVKTTSSGISTNWLTNARFHEPRGTGSGRSLPHAGQEHAGDVRHSARNAVGRCNGLRIESQVTAEFPQNFRAMALGHRLRNEIAVPVRKQRVSPEHLHACSAGSGSEVDGPAQWHQPIRVLERHQSAGARLISAELSHPIEKCGVLQPNGKRLPTGLRDATVKGRGIAKLRLALRQLFPESQPTLSALVSFLGALVIEPRL